MSARLRAVVVASFVVAGCGVRGEAGQGGEGGEGATASAPEVRAPQQSEAPSGGTTFAVAAKDIEVRPLAGAAARVLLSPATAGDDDASITLLELEEGTELRLPGGADSTPLAFVIEGRGTFRNAEGGAAGEPFAAGDAAFAPAGVPVGLRASEPSRVLVAYAAAGPEAAFLAGEGAAAAAAAGDGEIVVLLAQAASSFPIAGGLGEVTIYADEASVGDVRASLGLLEAGPGMEVPLHTHDDASETLYLLSGRGTMRAAERTFEARAGMAVQVPRGVEHAFVVEGDEPVRAVQLCAPAGPEQRFKR
jgi:quercetin dioxygenase-like cupin family protein